MWKKCDRSTSRNVDLILAMYAVHLFFSFGSLGPGPQKGDKAGPRSGVAGLLVRHTAAPVMKQAVKVLTSDGAELSF